MSRLLILIILLLGGGLSQIVEAQTGATVVIQSQYPSFFSGGGGVDTVEKELIEECLIVPALGSAVSSVEFGVPVWGEYEITQIGGVFPPLGTQDPTNVSTLDDRLIDGDLVNLYYHNSSAGSANKEQVAINLGTTPPNIVSFNVFHWRDVWLCTSFRIEGSNNLTVWDDITGPVTGVWQGAANIPQVVTLGTPQTYQYYRIYSLSGINGTWVTFSEFQAVSSGAVTQCNLFECGTITGSDSGGFVELVNDSGEDIEVCLYYYE